MAHFNSLMRLVSRKKISPYSKLDEVRRHISRWAESLKNGQKGLYRQKRTISGSLWPVLQDKRLARGGYVCFPREHSVQKNLFQVA